MSLSTHLTVLQKSAVLHRTSPVFRLPDIDSATGAVREWKVITYEQFLYDVEQCARYWLSTLSAQAIPLRTVVGMWLGGLTYTDLCSIYGVARAGYIPQLFSVRLPNPDVVYELLERANAKAIIYDSSFSSIISNCPIPTLVAVDVHSIAPDVTPLPALGEYIDGHDIAMIFHTSGSTSGSPKLVPCSYQWLNTIVGKAEFTSRPRNPGKQDVSVWMGSMCHIGQTFMTLGALSHGSCTIQPTKIAFSSEELVDMVQRCQLNRLNQFSSFLATHLRNARQDPKLFTILRNLDEIIFSGLPLPRDEEDWAYSNGLPMRNLFGNTECGAMLLSINRRDCSAPFLQPIEGVSYGFFPIAQGSDAETSHQNVNAILYELVILSDSGDCPHPSLRHADGHFHTGDLFVEAAPGCYLSRGRDDDWIKSENSLRCDTKAIEDNVRITCGDLVAECVVVGNGRPSPALFVEASTPMEQERLKKLIVRRTRQFHSRRYLHERITSTKFIVVVPGGSLPRTATKGNIRRRAVEEAFKTELDCIYSPEA